jgi:protein-tyrosine phosphatase
MMKIIDIHTHMLFGIDDGASDCEMSLELMGLGYGYVPIIAHVERYNSIYGDPLQDLGQLKELGCMIQINLYSIEQDRGHVGGGSRKELANLFLQQQLVDFVGTDTHRLDYKSPQAAVGAAALREKYGNEYADAVLYRNAEAFLR